jgi:hypothetical protein
MYLGSQGRWTLLNNQLLGTWWCWQFLASVKFVTEFYSGSIWSFSYLHSYFSALILISFFHIFFSPHSSFCFNCPVRILYLFTAPLSHVAWLFHCNHHDFITLKMLMTSGGSRYHLWYPSVCVMFSPRRKKQCSVDLTMMVHEMCVQALLMSIMHDAEYEGLYCLCAQPPSREFMCQTNIHLWSRHLHKK